MPTPSNATPARTVRLVTRTALPLLVAAAGSVLAVSTASAQQPQPTPYDQPWGPQPPPGAPTGAQPTGSPGAPPGAYPAQPGPGFGTEPPPGAGQPGAPPGAGFDVQGNVTFGGPGMAADASAKADAQTKPEDEWAERDRSLMEQINLLGSTGLLRTSFAQSGAAGTFRVGFLMDWFTTGGFLCNADTPCRPLAGAGQAYGDEDSASHVGAFFGLNITPISFLEAYAGIRTYANSNDHGSPQLLQVLGDTTLGVKAFMPDGIADVLHFGGEARLLLLNAAGSVGPSGGGTSAEFLALTTADFRKKNNSGIPLRLNLNFGYKVDNSGVVVEEVEALRAERDPGAANNLGRIPVSRIERFGLGINRVDFFKINFGVDVPYEYVQPYVEYTVDVPVNRQGYECHTSTISPGDVCLALQDLTDPTSGAPGYKAAPSRLTIGARTTPFSKAFRGLSAHLAIDIGLSATSTFIEEVAPQAPWTLYLGLGYAFDTKERKVEAPPPPPPPLPPVQLPPPPEYFARGLVKEAGANTPVPGAIITIEGRTEPPVASGPDGRFLTHQLAVGSFNLTITATGYKPGTCPVTIAAAAPTMPPAGVLGAPEPGGGYGAPPLPGQPPGAFGAPGAPPGAPPGPGQPPIAEQPPAPTGPVYAEVECQLEALPRKGSVEGAVMDSAGGSVAEASIDVTDAEGKAHKITAAGGSFSLKDLPPGKAKIKAEAKDYMLYHSEFTVKPREAAKVTVTLTKRPKLANVRVTGNEIQITKQIHFETDQATILGDSNELLAEIADVIHRTPSIKKIEIQGHTDNTGGKEHNDKLSQDRADAVRTWLVQHGIDGGRLAAKGYGQNRPIAPNITPANRARNRRVQFVIVEK
jgi:outer membrane protein OmpA-like peptidoglycan-associated protein